MRSESPIGTHQIPEREGMAYTIKKIGSGARASKKGEKNSKGRG